jgi:short-subunit dehydrogenase
MDIAGRLALVTGASSGIGAATARAVARKRGRVLLLARTRQALEQVAAEIKGAGGEAWVYPVDLADAGAVERTVDAIQRDVGVPDIIINNAGAGRWLWIEETSPADMVQMMAVPYFGAFYLTRAALPQMLRRNSGHIVNVTSVAGFMAWPGATAYTVARWAMRGFNEALRADLYGTRLGVTLFVSSLVRSPYLEHNPGVEERLPGVARMLRTLTADEVAAAIVRAIEREQREVILPVLLRIMMGLHRVLPRAVEGLLLKTGARRTADRQIPQS